MPTLAALYLFAAAPSASYAEQSATLVLFRDYAEPLLFKPTLFIDGTEVGRLAQKRLIAVQVPAGAHEIESRWPAFSGHRPSTVTVTIEPGVVSYVELTGTAAFWRTAATTSLVELPAGSGAAKVADCCKPAP
jgi:hypothetical protein